MILPFNKSVNGHCPIAVEFNRFQLHTNNNIFSYLVKCSLVNNGCSNQSDIIDAFAIGGTTNGGTFGNNLNYTNNIEKWVRISEGRYNNFIVTIVDQNLEDIKILDNNLLINFLIRVKK